jgi:hypothetical protein
VHKPHNSLAHPEGRPDLNKPRDTSAANPKHFADLRLKLGDKRATGELDDAESLPSDLSKDEWDEIVQFQKEQYEEEKKREQELFKQKKMRLREVLDRQLREQRELKEREVSEKRTFEQQLLQRMREKEEQEQAKQREMKNKIFHQKQMRDIQL